MTQPPTPDSAPPSRLARLVRFLARDPGNAALRADIFQAALAEGDFDEAQHQVVWALGRDPADFAWRHRLVLLDMARGEWDEARMLLAGLEAEGLGGPVIRYNLAYVDFAQGRVEDAQAKLAPLVEGQLEQVPESLAVLVSCLHRRGAPDEAVAAFARNAPRLAAPPAAALGAASLAAIDVDAAAAAADWADQALRRDPDQPEARIAKATLLLGLRDAAAARTLVAGVLARRPGDGRVLSTAAMADMLGGRLPEARALFERAVDAMPGHIGTWLAYGWCLLFLGDRADARAAFGRALALDANFGESHGALAVVDALEGHAGPARDGIRRAHGLEPGGLAAAYAQALLDGQAHDPQRFLALAERVLGRHATPDGRRLADVVLARR